MRRFLGWLALVLVLLAILVPVAALTFSVQVQGTSMTPTLAEGDRLLVNVLGGDDIERFDLVEVQFDRTAARAVKRVVGLPGDRVEVRFERGRPVVTVQPAGERTTYVVTSPTWAGQVGAERTEIARTTVPSDGYWVLGDNWGGSDDSRRYGFIPREHIGAKLGFRLMPLDSFGPVGDGFSLLPLDERTGS